MADKKFNLTFDVDANIGPIKNSISQLQGILKGLNVPQGLKQGLEGTFAKLNEEITNFQAIASKGFSDMGDINKAEKSYGKITDLVSKLRVQLSQVKGLDPKKFLPEETLKKLNDLEKSWNKLQDTVKKGDNTAVIEKQNKALEEQKQKIEELKKANDDLRTENKTKNGERTAKGKELKPAIEAKDKIVAQMQALEQSGKKSGIDYRELSRAYTEAANKVKVLEKEYKDLDDTIKRNQKTIKSNETEIRNLTTSNEELEATLNQLRTAAKSAPEGLNELRQKLAEIKGTDISKIPTDLNQLKQVISSLTSNQLQEIQQALERMAPAEQEVTDNAKAMGRSLEESSKAGADINARANDVEQLANRVKYFFSLTNSVMLFRRAIKSAINTVKELDEVMTQTAVVTKFTVEDMWGQLPQYTQRANELGVTIKGVYEASTLYYQQGLKTNEVIGVANETLKLAKIAGLDYATATDYMTSALRGFNMEVNELSAKQVNDIYSQLAAHTASNVEEISIAMSKVAPLAHNAGMEIETTAAMLAQMIEKTREAPETLGTAMKTVIARFQELKKAPSEIEEIDGEIVDANKVEKALRTVGIALRDTSGQFRELDDVFLELSAKWDTLDTNTQRYIATIAAGSRQQSRFIAMMADYKRTMELVQMANTSAGASQQQFEKTLESMETKLNRLKNAWNEFTMGLANNAVLKAGIDLLSGFINTINKMTSALSGKNTIFKSLLDVGVLIGGIKLGKVLFTNFFGWLARTAVVKGKAAGTAASVGFTTSLKRGLVGIQKLFKKGTWIGKGVLIDTKEITKAKTDINNLRKTIILTKNDLGNRPPNLFANLSKATRDYEMALEGVGRSLSLTNAQQATSNSLQAMGVTEGIANAAAVGGLTEEKAKEYMATAMANGASKEEAKQRLKNISLLYAEAGTQKLNNTIQQQGLLTRAKNIVLLLFGDKAARKKAMSDLGMAAADTAAAGAQTALNTAMEACPIGWILLAVAALIALLVIFIKLAKNASLQAQMDKAAKATKQAKEAADKAKEAYDNLLSNRSEYNDLQQQLEDLTYGTQEWKEALLEVNQEVLKLIQEYPELAKYIGKGAYGQLIISDEGWDKQIQLAQAKVITTSGSLALSQNYERQLQDKSEERRFRKTTEYFDLKDIVKAGIAETLTGGISDLVYLNEQIDLTRSKGKTFGMRRDDKTAEDLLKTVRKQSTMSVADFQQELENIGKTSQLSAEQFEEATKAAIEYNNALEESKIQNQKTAKAFLEASIDFETFDKLGPEVKDKITDAFGNFMNSSAFNKQIEKEKSKYQEAYLSELDIYGIFRGKIIESAGIQDQLNELAEQYNVKHLMAKNNIMQNVKLVYAAMNGLETDSKSLKDIKLGYSDMVNSILRGSLGNELVDKINQIGKDWETYSKETQQAILFATSNGEFYRNEKKIDINSKKDVNAFLSQFTEAELKAIESVYGSKEEFIKEYNAAVIAGEKDLNTIRYKLSAALGNEVVEGLNKLDLDNAAKKALGNTLLVAFQASGEEAAQGLSETIFSMFEGKTQEEADALATAINSIDPKNIDSIRGISDIIENLGYSSSFTDEELNNLEQELIRVAKASADIDLEKLKESLKTIGQIAYDLKTGKQGRAGFSEETKNYLIEKGLAETTDFAIDFENGGFIYVGKSLDALTTAVMDNTKAILGDTTTTLEEKIKIGEVAQEWLDRSKAPNGIAYRNTAVIGFLASGYSDKYSLDWLENEKNEGRGEAAYDTVYKHMQTMAGSISKYTQDLAYTKFLKAVNKKVIEYTDNIQGLLRLGETDENVVAMKTLAVQAGVVEDAINELSYSELAAATQAAKNAKAHGIETDELGDYAKALLKTKNAQVDSMDKAYEYALANKRIQIGLQELTDNYEKWYEVLEKGYNNEAEKGSPEYLQAAGDYKRAVENLINADTELSDDWLEENIENLNKIMNHTA